LFVNIFAQANEDGQKKSNLKTNEGAEKIIIAGIAICHFFFLHLIPGAALASSLLAQPLPAS